MSRYQDAIFEMLRADGYITVSKPLSAAIGILEAAVYSELVSRHFYFAERNQLTEDGYFFNTIEDVGLLTRLTGYQQKAVIARLKELGLIDYQVRGLPAQRYFRVVRNPEVLLPLIEEGRNRLLKVKNIHSLSKTSKLDSEKLERNKRGAPEEDFDTGHELGMWTAIGESMKPKRWGKRN